jgi:hypothetical protein
MSRLSPPAAERDALLAGALFIAGVGAWAFRQELLPTSNSVSP